MYRTPAIVLADASFYTEEDHGYVRGIATGCRPSEDEKREGVTVRHLGDLTAKVKTTEFVTRAGSPTSGCIYPKVLLWTEPSVSYRHSKRPIYAFLES